jgi:AcrR family transcriptional regulator
VSEPAVEPRGRLRDRVRARTVAEVKQVALRQIEAGGAAALSVNAIAKELGVSGPALYRYFASRDALLTALIVDAYGDLASHLAAATAPVERSRRPAELAKAYRLWAVEQPHRYRLLFAAPLAGYDAHARDLVAASQVAMDVLLDAVSGLSDPSPQPVPVALERELHEWAVSRGVPHASPGTALRAIHLWACMHGVVSLEIDGNFASMGLDGRMLYESALAEVVGLDSAHVLSAATPQS